MRTWLSMTAVLLAGFTLTTVATQFAAIGVLDITSGRLLTSAAIVVTQGVAITFLLKKVDRGTR